MVYIGLLNEIESSFMFNLICWLHWFHILVNFSWDRIVGEQLVLKSNQDNRNLMKQLSDVARKKYG